MKKTLPDHPTFWLLVFLLVLASGKAFGQAPVITSFSPASGPVGSTLTINGSGFNVTAGNNVVYMGAAKATVKNSSATQLTVTVPAGVTFKPITVVNTGTRLSASSTSPFITTFNGKHVLAAADFDGKADLFSLLNISAVNFADLDGDGKPDMIVSSAYVVSVFRNISNAGTINQSSFAGKVDFSVPGARTTMVQDMDGDGKPDIVISTGNGAIILQNQAVAGSISSASFATFDIGGLGSVTGIAVADVDLDGRPDVILSHDSANQGFTVTVTHNTSLNGKLSFDFPLKYNNALRPLFLVTSDVDGDGKPDLVFLNDDNSVDIMPNKSAPAGVNFGTTVHIAAKNGATTSIQMADMDGDGKQDMLLTHSTYQNGTHGFIISIYKNIATQGSISTASFGNEVGVLAGDQASNLTIADIDGDGKPDIIFEDIVLSVMLNNTTTPGNFSFSSKLDLLSGLNHGPTFINICDIDGDGNPDIVYNETFNSTQAYNYTVSAFRYNPKPAAAVVPAPVINSVSPASAQIGSNVIINGANFGSTVALNSVYFGSAKAGIVSASATQITAQVPVGTTSLPVSVINTQTALSGFSATPFTNTWPVAPVIDVTAFKTHSFVNTAQGPSVLVSGDLDGDGKPDMVSSGEYGGTPGYNFSIFPNRSTGIGSLAFGTRIAFATTGAVSSIKLCDVDGDGKQDIVVGYFTTNAYTFSVYLNKSVPGTIAFSNEFSFPYSIDNLQVADMNSDGKPDVIGQVYGQKIAILKNTSTVGSVSFDPPVSFGGNYGAGFDVADVDGDGKPDLITTTGTKTGASVFRNSSVNGGFAFEGNVDIANVGAKSLLVDMDGDGKIDMLSVDIADTKTVNTFRNTSIPGKISFAADKSFTFTEGVKIWTGDMNGDSKPDLLVAGFTSQKISAMQNKSTVGAIDLATKVDYTPTAVPNDLSAVDLDGDGKSDLVFTYFTTQTSYGIDILRNELSALPTPTITAGGPTIIAAGGSVVLNALPGTGYNYQWVQNGVNIPGANAVTFTATQDASYTVVISQGNDTKSSAPTVVSILSSKNYNIAVTNASCKGSANGSITITASRFLNYTVSLTGPSSSNMAFTGVATLSSLAAGTYNVCISVAGQSAYQQCYTLIVWEPKDLALYATVNSDNQTLTLNLSGGSIYHIQLNGVLHSTADSVVKLNLNTGRNDILVTTDKPCQGVIQKTITAGTNIVPYPDPFDRLLYLNIGDHKVKTALVQVYSAMGNMVYKGQFNNPAGTISLDLSVIQIPGTYTLKLTTDGMQQAFKIIKK